MKRVDLWRHFPPGTEVQVWRRVSGHQPPSGPPKTRVLATAVVQAQPHATELPDIADSGEKVTAPTAYPAADPARTVPLYVSGQVDGVWKHITVFGTLVLEQRRLS